MLFISSALAALALFTPMAHVLITLLFVWGGLSGLIKPMAPTLVTLCDLTITSRWSVCQNLNSWLQADQNRASGQHSLPSSTLDDTDICLHALSINVTSYMRSLDLFTGQAMLSDLLVQAKTSSLSFAAELHPALEKATGAAHDAVSGVQGLSANLSAAIDAMSRMELVFTETLVRAGSGISRFTLFNIVCGLGWWIADPLLSCEQNLPTPMRDALQAIFDEARRELDQLLDNGEVVAERHADFIEAISRVWDVAWREEKAADLKNYGRRGGWLTSWSGAGSDSDMTDIEDQRDVAGSIRATASQTRCAARRDALVVSELLAEVTELLRFLDQPVVVSLLRTKTLQQTLLNRGRTLTGIREKLQRGRHVRNSDQGS